MVGGTQRAGAARTESEPAYGEAHRMLEAAPPSGRWMYRSEFRSFNSSRNQILSGQSEPTADRLGCDFREVSYFSPAPESKLAAKGEHRDAMHLSPRHQSGRFRRHTPERFALARRNHQLDQFGKTFLRRRFRGNMPILSEIDAEHHRKVLGLSLREIQVGDSCSLQLLERGSLLTCCRLNGGSQTLKSLFGNGRQEVILISKMTIGRIVRHPRAARDLAQGELA